MSGIHGPNNFIQSRNHLAGFVAHLLQITAPRLKRRGGRSRSGPQHGDLSETRSQLIMEVLGDASPFLLHGMLLLHTLSFPDLDFKFSCALFDLAVKLSNPEHRDSQDASQST